MADNADLVRYCNCINEVRNRIDLANQIIAGALPGASEEILAEVLAIQLRKSLELVALAALSANRPYYEPVYKGIEGAWNAKRILQEIGALHEHFYPTPIVLGPTSQNGIRNFEPLKSGFLTKEQFVSIYDKLAGVLHAWNPHRPEPRAVGKGIDFAEWFRKLERLLALHYFHLPNDDSIYVCEMRSHGGNVHVYTGTPRAG